MTKLSILVSKIALFLILINEIQAQNKLYQSFNYRNIGPARGGRVTAVAGVETKIGSFYMGATGGGVYKPMIMELLGIMFLMVFLTHHL